MVSLHVTTIFIFYFAFLCIIKGDDETVIVPCFINNINVEIHQFDDRISIKYINCSRQLKKHIFTITFELQRQFTNVEHMFESNMVVTLFAGPCSSSTATLNIGRTFPSIYGTLDGSHPATIASSHLSWNEQSQKGTITYEYGGEGGDFAQLISVLIHVVVRYGREEMIKGIYALKFSN